MDKERKDMSSLPFDERICNHCGGLQAIRNPKGFCDHLYYPDACEVCTAERKKVNPTRAEELEAIIKELVESMEAWEDCDLSFRMQEVRSRARKALGK